MDNRDFYCLDKCLMLLIGLRGPRKRAVRRGTKDKLQKPLY